MRNPIRLTVFLMLGLLPGLLYAASATEVSQQIKDYLRQQSADLTEMEKSVAEVQKSFLQLTSTEENSGFGSLIDKAVGGMQGNPLLPKLKDVQAASKNLTTGAAKQKEDLTREVSAAQSSIKQITASIDKLSTLADQLKPSTPPQDTLAKVQAELSNLGAAQGSVAKFQTASLDILAQNQASFSAALGAFNTLKSDGNFGNTPGLSGGDMVQKMAQMNMEFLALQESIQMETRRFQTLSNTSKAKHALILSAIKQLK